jgi:hypothetical protein
METTALLHDTELCAALGMFPDSGCCVRHPNISILDKTSKGESHQKLISTCKICESEFLAGGLRQRRSFAFTILQVQKLHNDRKGWNEFKQNWNHGSMVSTQSEDSKVEQKDNPNVMGNQQENAWVEYTWQIVLRTSQVKDWSLAEKDKKIVLLRDELDPKENKDQTVTPGDRSVNPMVTERVGQSSSNIDSDTGNMQPPKIPHRRASATTYSMDSSSSDSSAGLIEIGANDVEIEPNDVNDMEKAPKKSRWKTSTNMKQRRSRSRGQEYSMNLAKPQNERMDASQAIDKNSNIGKHRRSLSRGNYSNIGVPPSLPTRQASSDELGVQPKINSNRSMVSELTFSIIDSDAEEDSYETSDFSQQTRSVYSSKDDESVENTFKTSQPEEEYTPDNSGDGTSYNEIEEDEYSIDLRGESLPSLDEKSFPPPPPFLPQQEESGQDIQFDSSQVEFNASQSSAASAGESYRPTSIKEMKFDDSNQLLQDASRALATPLAIKGRKTKSRASTTFKPQIIASPGLGSSRPKLSVEGRAPKRTTTPDLRLLNAEDIFDQHVALHEKKASAQAITKSRVAQIDIQFSSQEANGAYPSSGENNDALASNEDEEDKEAGRVDILPGDFPVSEAGILRFSEQPRSLSPITCVTMLTNEHEPPVIQEEEDIQPSKGLGRRGQKLLPLEESFDSDEESEDGNQSAKIHTKKEIRTIQVTDQIINDKYGDSGLYTGSVNADTLVPHGNGSMVYENEREYNGIWEEGKW